MTAKVLMVQGTTSDAGKSTLVAGLCRLLARQGVAVAPFKPQNMALNSAVTLDGGEIGRAQALQAAACYLAPHTDFNPILLKPSSDTGAQIIVHGKALSTLEASDFFGEKSKDYKVMAMKAVLTSFTRLTASYETLLVEGAGSPAEINLREGDIANMGFAEAVDCPVIIIADIDKGGVFAHLVGTLALLSESEQARVKGFVINRFRGDISLLKSGLDWLEAHTGKPVLGVLPYLHDLHLDAEDALIASPDKALAAMASRPRLKVLVLVFPRISNHTDFDPLRLHPDVDFEYVSLQTQASQQTQSLPPCDLLILPGSKNVRADLAFLREQAWDMAIEKHLRYGGKVLGICGGYQMLGHSIADPEGIEGIAGESLGLGWLPIATELSPQKQLRQVVGELCLMNQTVAIQGYEIHCGESVVDNALLAQQPCGIPIHLTRETATVADGLCSQDGQVLGTYVHGLFDQSTACQLLLQWAGQESASPMDINTLREQQLNRLADVLEQHLDIELIRRILM